MYALLKGLQKLRTKNAAMQRDTMRCNAMRCDAMQCRAEGRMLVTTDKPLAFSATLTEQATLLVGGYPCETHKRELRPFFRPPGIL